MTFLIHFLDFSIRTYQVYGHGYGRQKQTLFLVCCICKPHQHVCLKNKTTSHIRTLQVLSNPVSGQLLAVFLPVSNLTLYSPRVTLKTILLLKGRPLGGQRALSPSTLSTQEWLVDFTLSNARQFNSSKRDPLRVKYNFSALIVIQLLFNLKYF